VKISTALLFTLLSCNLLGQNSKYNHCSGAVFAPIEGRIALPFLGEQKINQIWLVYRAPSAGVFNLDINIVGSSLNSSVGKLYTTNEEYCKLSTSQKKNCDSLIFELRGQHQLNIHLEKNQYAQICLQTQEKLKNEVIFTSQFSAEQNQHEEQVLNLVYDHSLPVYSILLRDGEQKTPITGRIILQGSPEINGSYFASRLQINMKQPIKKGNLKIEAQGYFPQEFKEIRLPMSSSKIDTIYLRGFKAGELTKLEQVYFSAGSPEILEESYEQLNRLRDFLLLNPNVKIEIHGHVNIDENSAKKAQQLSKQRAIMVKNYLVSTGIAPNRLYPIGFGTSKPVFAKPKDETEKEANRRVEILIKEN
jgi:outer membrane protein OmpA-like peptidoglycan-associated protein